MAMRAFNGQPRTPAHSMTNLRCWLLFIGMLSSLQALGETEGDATASQLLAVLKHGVLIKETENKFQNDLDKPLNVSMYGLSNAIFWTANMEIDCDGRETDVCNKGTDPAFQSQTSCGVDIAANETPYFVIPTGSPANSKQRGIEYGQVGAIIYRNQVVYAVFLDECSVPSLIGEASYATAKLLGVNPDPKNGGTDDPVTYVVFTGPSGRITNNKEYGNHLRAVSIGLQRAKELLRSYAEPEPAQTVPKKEPTGKSAN
jgi:hypothetical protein